MTDDKRRKLDDAISELDLRLDGLLGRLGASLGEMVDRLEQGDDGEIRRSHEIRTPRGPLRTETGVRVRVGGAAFGGGADDRRPARPVSPEDLRTKEPSHGSGAGEPHDDRAGDMSVGTGSAEPGSDEWVEDVPARAPHLEAYTTDGRWHLCADLPGVTLTDIDIAIGQAEAAHSPGTLILTTRGARRYAARHALPPGIDPDDMSLVLRNGVLEIGFGLGPAS